MNRTPPLAFLALTFSACALAPATERPLSSTQEPATDPVVEVRNDHLLSVRIFTFWSGTRYFLGEVPPGTVASFRVPRELVRGDQIRLLADPIGSADEYMTDPVELGGGRHIEWQVRTYLRGSRLRIM